MDCIADSVTGETSDVWPPIAVAIDSITPDTSDEGMPTATDSIAGTTSVNEYATIATFNAIN